MVDRLHILWGEVAHMSVAAAPPAQRVGAVDEFDDVAAQEAELRGVVGGEVEESVGMMRTPGEVLGVPQIDGPLLSDAVAMVELHKLVEGGEELIPHVVLRAAVLQHFEVLDVVPITDRHGKLPGSALAFPDQKRPALPVSESTLRHATRYPAGEPGVRPQVDVVLWHKAFSVVELSCVPVRIVLHVGDL